MKIPQPLKQFNRKPTLIIVAGDYEAKFLVAQDGSIEEKKDLQFSMREDGKEKQAYTHANPSPERMGAVSHFGPYKKDLEEKFYKATQKEVYNLIYDESIEEIYLFAPSQRVNGIYENLSKRAQEKLKGKFNGEYINHSPIQILEIWGEKSSSETPKIHYTKEEKKILDKPQISRKEVKKKFGE